MQTSVETRTTLTAVTFNVPTITSCDVRHSINDVVVSDQKYLMQMRATVVGGRDPGEARQTQCWKNS